MDSGKSASMNTDQKKIFAKVATGDWLMLRPTPGNETLFEKGILLNAHHTHDEVIAVESGETYCGSAQWPHFKKVGLADRIIEAEAGKIVYAIFRWYGFIDGPLSNSIFYEKCQEAVVACVKFAILLRVPYDVTAIRTHVRNYIRSRLHVKWLPPILTTHKEDHVFCTESNLHIYAVAGITPMETDGQPLPHPVHADKMVANKKLLLVHDGGLMKYMKAEQK